MTTRGISANSARDVVSVKSYGVVGNGTADDTAALQACFTAVRLAGGGLVYFPPGTYIVNRSILMGSKTRAFGAGAASLIKASQSGFVGANGGSYATFTCPLLQNYNYAQGSLTDTDITISNLAFDYGTVTIYGGGAHHVAMRSVNRVIVKDCFFNNGEVSTSMLGCRDTLVEGCVSTDQGYSFYDHWDGVGGAKVINCVGRSSVLMYQGIQMSSAGTLDEVLTSVDCLVMGCSLYGVRNSSSNNAAAIIVDLANSVNTGSLAYRFTSIGNYVEDSDIGVAFIGGGGQHLSIGDTLNNVTKLPIYIGPDNADNTTPSNCRIINPHLIDCNHSVAGVALMAIAGTNNEVLGLKVTNSGAVTYDYLAYFAATATSCLVDIADQTSGDVARVLNSGTLCRVLDGDRSNTPAAVSAGTYTQLINDTFLNFTGTGCTVTLLAAATYPGKKLYLRTTVAFTVISASSNVVPVAGGAAGTAILAATAGKWAELVSDGTNWVIMGAN